MAIDFNNEGKQSTGYDLVPKGTVAPFAVYVRPGGVGEDGMLTQSKSSDVQYLDIEFTIEEGPFARRKIFQKINVSGGKLDEKGNSIAGQIGRAQLKAILESGRRINPDDQSEQAKAARWINSYADLNGLSVWGKIGIEKDKTGKYDDKNRIDLFLTPDMKDYGKMTGDNQGNQWQQPSCQPPQQAYQPPQQPAQQQWRNAQPSENAGPAPGWAQ